MGHKFSVVQGVKSENFYEPGNAINEIWVGDFEIISRLPFGDSDIGQAGWSPGNWPKIPWHQFIIPLKRDFSAARCSKLDCEINPRLTTLTNSDKALLFVGPLILFVVLVGIIIFIFHLLVKLRNARVLHSLRMQWEQPLITSPV